MISRRTTATVCDRGPVGFTVVEIMVACVVTATAMLAVYSVFQQAMQVRGKAGAAWEARGAAQAIVSHIAEGLERVVNLSTVPTILCRPGQKSGEHSMKCLVEEAGWPGTQGRQPCLRWRRYSWNCPAGTGEPGSVKLQTLTLAGTKVVTPAADPEGNGEKQVWSQVDARVIATGLRELSILCRPLDEPAGRWQDRWEGHAGSVAIRIRATVGDETVERIIVPQVNAVSSMPEGQ